MRQYRRCTRTSKVDLVAGLEEGGLGAHGFYHARRVPSGDERR
jgi:hypothetical protein